MTDNDRTSSVPGAAEEDSRRGVAEKADGVADNVHGAAGEDGTRDALSAPTAVQGEEGGGAPDVGAEQDTAEPTKKGDGFEGLQPHRKYD